MSTIELKSPRDGSVLAFSVTGRSDNEVDFDVSVRTPWFHGTTPASTFYNGSPSELFRGMSRDWRGWKGEKSWQDLGCRVALSAQADSVGHIKLRVQLSGDHESRLVAVLEYEAGQLEEMSKAVAGLLG
jgi:hypothetical protein